MKKYKKILLFIYVLLCIIVIVGSLYIKKIYPEVLFEELLFYVTNGVNNSSSSLIIEGIKSCFILVIMLSIILYNILYKLKLASIILKKINKSKFIWIVRLFYCIVLFIFSVYILLYNINFWDYYKNQNTISSFIEDNYIDPKSVNITFPEEKRNLITIYVESLETSMFTKDVGGYWNYEVIGELYKLLGEDDVVYFYDNNDTELMQSLSVSAWTTGGTVANSSGLPLKIPIQRSSYHSYNFMSGAYSIGDLLKDNGYYNELISSARTNFGGIKEYFTKHGNYKIIDITTYSNFGLELDKSDLGDWGFNDNFLFESAKKRLEKISKKGEPFNLVLQTIDTHYVDGFIGDYSVDTYDTEYENAYATESKLIYDFIKWVREQDFYDNTTILIVGDHVSMQKDYFTSRGVDKRYIYNCYINSSIDSTSTSDRIYTPFDTYPTVLASMGVKIEGNKLGLGTNLFSNINTLAEEYGLDYLNDELSKKSVFYNEVILGSDYDEMVEELEEKEEENVE